MKRRRTNSARTKNSKIMKPNRDTRRYFEADKDRAFGILFDFMPDVPRNKRHRRFVELAKEFQFQALVNVSESTVHRWYGDFTGDGTQTVSRQSRSDKAMNDCDLAVLRCLVEEEPRKYLREYQRDLLRIRRKKFACSILCRELHLMGYTKKVGETLVHSLSIA